MTNHTSGWPRVGRTTYGDGGGPVALQVNYLRPEGQSPPARNGLEAEEELMGLHI